MYKHVILWKLKDEFSESEKEEILANAKKNLEALNGQIPGLISLKIIYGALPSSNCDLMLDSSFTSQQALSDYGKNELHVSLANKYIKPFVEVRMCLDYKENE